MTVEHNPAPLTDEEWERVCNIGGSWSNIDRSRLNLYRAAGVTIEPPPAPRYRACPSLERHDGWNVEDTHWHRASAYRSAAILYLATFRGSNAEGDAKEYADVLNGKAEIVYGGGE